MVAGAVVLGLLLLEVFEYRAAVELQGSNVDTAYLAFQPLFGLFPQIADTYLQCTATGGTTICMATYCDWLWTPRVFDEHHQTYILFSVELVSSCSPSAIRSN